MGPRELHDTIPSTQDRAIELARAGAPEGTRVVARAQTNGRGRLDHTWWSPNGAGLYLTLLIDAPPPPRTLLALAIGVEIADELAVRYRIRAAVKWPNDLLIPTVGPPRKISGILIDEVVAADGRLTEVVGVGVNVRSVASDAPPELRGRLAAIGDWVDPAPDLDEVEGWVVDAVFRASHQLREPEGASRAVVRCTASLYGRGRPARLDGVAVGRIEGIGTEGELWVRQGPDRIAIRAGDVEVEDGP